MFQWCNKNLVDRWGRPALLWKIILFCLYFEVCCLTMLWAPVRYLMVSIEIVSIEWEGGWAIRWRDNITKYVVQTQHSVYHIKYFLYNRYFLACSDKDKWQYTTSPTPHPPTIWCPMPLPPSCLVQQPLGLVRTCWNVPALSFTRIKIALIVLRENAAPGSDLTLPGQIIVYSLPGIRDYQSSCAAKQLEILLNLQKHNWFCSTKIYPDIASC